LPWNPYGVGANNQMFVIFSIQTNHFFYDFGKFLKSGWE